MFTQKSHSYKPNLLKIFLYLSPALIIYGFIVIVPIIGAFKQSLFTDLNFQLKFVGFQNYLRLLKDDNFWLSFRNNMTILGLSLVLQIGLAFIISVMMNSKQVKWSKFYRTVMFFPVILSPVVVAFIWILIYNINWGLLNSILRGAGLETWTQLWLDNPKIVIYSITVPLMWQYVGLFLVIFLAGLTSIPDELLEAAAIDGASNLQKTIHITLPLMAKTWRVVLVLAISGAVKVFEQPFVMTRGGPGMSSTVLAQYAYDMSFSRLKITYGSTIAIGMLIVSLILILLSWFVMDKVIFKGMKDQNEIKN